MESTSSPAASFSDGPFSGLIICVTGFSKEARKQIMEATERLGGEYSPNLHSGCTHLLVKSVGGRKLEHAFKYRYRAGLFIVTFQWFIGCVTRNVRLRESLYSIQAVTKTSDKIAESCDNVGFNHALKPAKMIEECFQSSDVAFQESMGPCMLGRKMYIDLDVSAELRIKVMEAANQIGAIIMDEWLVGCGASYVVCEGSSILRYLGHVDNIVTPVWVLKTAKQRFTQRFIRFSADLAREVGMLLENLRDGSITGQMLSKGRKLHSLQKLALEIVGIMAGSEKNELIFRHHFITILFPVDRFSEMGPSSRTFYSEKGFTCLQLLDLIYVFYQENMSDNEIEAAIHTDSRHADRLRAMYSDKTRAELGRLVYKRIEFMGSRRFLEMLKRISGDNSGNVYELVIRA